VDREHGRRRWIINRKLERHRSTEIATALRVDERTVYRWWSVYRKHGWAELAVKSHRPHMIHRTPRPTAGLILQLRRTRNWGPCRIEAWGRLKCLGEVLLPVCAALRGFARFWYSYPSWGSIHVFPIGDTIVSKALGLLNLHEIRATYSNC